MMNCKSNLKIVVSVNILEPSDGYIMYRKEIVQNVDLENLFQGHQNRWNRPYSE